MFRKRFQPKYFKNPNNPHEAVESMNFAEWLDILQKQDRILKFGHIPNETRTPYMGELSKQKAMGVTRGLPDYVIALAPRHSVDGVATILWVEMKRVEGIPSDVKQEQKEWLAILNDTAGNASFVAFGFERAKEFVELYIK